MGRRSALVFWLTLSVHLHAATSRNRSARATNESCVPSKVCAPEALQQGTMLILSETTPTTHCPLVKGVQCGHYDTSQLVSVFAEAHGRQE